VLTGQNVEIRFLNSIEENPCKRWECWCLAFAYCFTYTWARPPPPHLTESDKISVYRMVCKKRQGFLLKSAQL